MSKTFYYKNCVITDLSILQMIFCDQKYFIYVATNHE